MGVFLDCNFINYCNNWSQQSRISQIAKLRAKVKNPSNMGVKMPFFGIFGLKFDKIQPEVTNGGKVRMS